MPSVDTSKKPAPSDWHPAFIVYRLRLKNMSLRRLSAQHGYAPKSLMLAVRRPWPAAEKIIAKCIGVAPQEIWPSRYDANGKTLTRPKGGYHPSRNLSTGSQRSVIQRDRTNKQR